MGFLVSEQQSKDWKFSRNIRKDITIVNRLLRYTICRMMNSKTLRLRVMHGDTIAFGPGKVDLLLGIERSGSISAAARDMDMSYRRAWILVQEMNSSFAQPLVETATGGARGGGARITELAHTVIERYRRMQSNAEKAVADDMAFLQSLIVVTPD